MRGTCGINAICKTILHRATCTCPNCYIGQPEVECKMGTNCEDTSLEPRDPNVKNCIYEEDCSESTRCLNGQCLNPCTSPNFKCENNKKCVVKNHQGFCVCKSGFIVNEIGELICAPEKKECTKNDDCTSNTACQNGKCVNPCVQALDEPAVCPENKSCEVQNHKPICICMKDCQPSISICLRDTGCPSDLACKNYQCVNPCDYHSCYENSPCIVEDHKPICKFCPPGFIADSKVGCRKGKLKIQNLYRNVCVNLYK